MEKEETECNIEVNYIKNYKLFIFCKLSKMTMMIKYKICLKDNKKTK
jgi:hypothetical protein